MRQKFTGITANATLNLKVDPSCFTVHGSIMTMRQDDKVKISVSDPQGTNPQILIFDLKIIEGDGPIRMTPKHFYYSEEIEDTKEFYDKVIIRYNEDSLLTIDIEKFG